VPIKEPPNPSDYGRKATEKFISNITQAKGPKSAGADAC
jgi:hypothetical protein